MYKTIAIALTISFLSDSPTQEEVILASLIQCERLSGTEYTSTADGADIASSVMYRVESKVFPNTIKEVIYQNGQFDGTQSPKWGTYTRSDLLTARKAIMGKRTLPMNTHYFLNPCRSSDSAWVRKLQDKCELVRVNNSPRLEEEVNHYYICHD